MGLVRLDDTVPLSGQIFYLDTTAIAALAFDRSASFGGDSRPKERTRARRLKAFFAKANAAKAKTRTSTLAMEELASIVKNKCRQDALRAVGFLGSWREYVKAHSAAAVAVDDQIRAPLKEILTHAFKALEANAIKLQRPETLAEHTVAAEVARATMHQRLLAKYGAIDSMDALHIATGIELGAYSFVSFDTGWGTVENITVHQ